MPTNTSSGVWRGGRKRETHQVDLMQETGRKEESGRVKGFEGSPFARGVEQKSSNEGSGGKLTEEGGGFRQED